MLELFNSYIELYLFLKISFFLLFFSLVKFTAWNTLLPWLYRLYMSCMLPRHHMFGKLHKYSLYEDVSARLWSLLESPLLFMQDCTLQYHLNLSVTLSSQKIIILMAPFILRLKAWILLNRQLLNLLCLICFYFIGHIYSLGVFYQFHFVQVVLSLCFTFFL